MNGHVDGAGGSSLLELLLAISPIQLPGLTVFFVSLRKARAVSGALCDLLDSEEKARSTDFATWDLRHRYTTGRAALRTILSMLVKGSVPAADWRFGASANGKPYVRTPESSIRSFNISYAEDLVAIAVSEEIEVGVDIEIKREIPQLNLPWHLFSADEQRLLKTTALAHFTPVFLRLWTLKEAVAKRIGQGFATEFSEIDTLTLPVVDGFESVGQDWKPGSLLFHSELSIGADTVFLSVAAAPIGSDRNEPV